ncbi:C45 family peptidase [Clostridium estertheticum]|uniref:C45 family autoproteolytic acyltransferase/hydolase n=1 Tax=Clostridium estertheticum TaxID=238834 RepID=UPI001C0AF330|nr:C45 family peptidase [Clostridium estertheticum]MBU3175920.1 C45 family peptidase [Clostridium estertheticum]
MNYKNSALKVLEVSGEPIERGKQIGEAKRPEIKEFIEQLHNNYCKCVGEVLSIDELVNYMSKSVNYSKKYCLDLYNEMLGISHGANIDMNKILFINLFLELVNLRSPLLHEKLLGCTSFGITSEATLNKHCYIGQNFDMEQFYKDYSYILKIKDGNSSTMIFTFAGVLGCAGFNSQGIGVSINYLQSRDIERGGMLFPFVVRNILKQTIIGDAIGAAMIGEHACGINYLIGDASGNYFDVEVSGKDLDIIYPAEGILSHSNHYLSPSLKKLDMMVFDTSTSSSITRRGNTVVRQQVMKSLLLQNRGKIDLDSIKEIVANHTNYPYSICRHGNVNESSLINNETVASIIFDLSDRTMYAANGVPCENSFYKYTL